MKYLLDTHTILWYLFRKLPITLDDFNKVKNLPFQESIKHNDPYRARVHKRIYLGSERLVTRMNCAGTLG
ncbi:hypothetical protein [Treponema lecithinolyticum]